MESKRLRIARRAVGASAAFVAVLVVLYAFRISRPTGYREVAEARRAEWEKPRPVAAERPRGTRSLPLPSPTPAPPPGALTLSNFGYVPVPRFGWNGPLGFSISTGVLYALDFTVPDSRAARSGNPMDWESLPDIEDLRRRSAIEAATQGGPRMPPVTDPAPEVLRAELDRLEGEIFGSGLAPDDFDSFRQGRGSPICDGITAVRWIVLRALAAGDVEKAARYLPSYADMELGIHRNTMGGDLVSEAGDANAFLALALSSPQAPPEAMAEMQARFEAALLTDEELALLRDRQLARTHRRLTEWIQSFESRERNSWHGLMDGLLEETVNSALLPGLKYELDVYTKALMEKDRATAKRSAIRMTALWKVSNLNGDAVSWYTNWYDQEWPMGMAASGLPLQLVRRLRYNYEIETSIVLIAGHRYRADHGRAPERGSDLVPDYLTEEFLRSTGSAWRFFDGDAGPVLVRFDPEWAIRLQPDGTRIATRPGGLGSAKENETAPTGGGQLFHADVLRGLWEERAAELLRPLWSERGS